MVKVGIVGVGSISAAHLEGYCTFPDRCRVVAACDTEGERAAERLAGQGLRIPVYPDLGDLLEHETPDLVSICTPPFTHRELAVHALSRGVHVLCEKPMASSLQECDAMLGAQHAGGAMLSIVAQNRFRTALWNLKRLLSQGAIGRLLHTQVNSYWWRGTWEHEGGGCTLNHAVHHIDLLIWLTGMPARVVAMMGNVGHPNSQVEDLSMALLEYSDGSFAQVTSSVVHHGERQEIILQGTDARISAPWLVDAAVTTPGGFPKQNAALEQELSRRIAVLGELPREGHAGQIDDVLSAIDEGRPPLVSGTDGRSAIELITSIYKSATTRTSVTLPLTDSDAFYRADTLLQVVPRYSAGSESQQSPRDAAVSRCAACRQADPHAVSRKP